MDEDCEDTGELEKRFQDLKISLFQNLKTIFMATINNFEELEIWQGARRLNKKVIVLMQNPAVEKNFRLKNQISESTGSVMDNIAGGFERDSRLEFINLLSCSKGSTGEMRSQLYRGFDNGYYLKKH